MKARELPPAYVYSRQLSGSSPSRFVLCAMDAETCVLTCINPTFVSRRTQIRNDWIVLYWIFQL